MDSLGVDEDEITPEATLQGDLGGESIDFLDIVFRLEQQIGIKIARGELFPESIFSDDPELVCAGRVTDEGVDRLRAIMPYADLSRFDSDRRLSAVADLFTVDLVTRFVGWKLCQGARVSNPDTLEYNAHSGSPTSKL
jgi:acyl carrier protein